MDIRNFFGKKSAPAAAPSSAQTVPAKRKAKALVISSDEDEDPTPKKAGTASSKPNLKKLKTTEVQKSPKGKPVDASSAFGSEPIKRVERTRANRSLTQQELEQHFGDDLDEDLVLESSLIEEEQKVNDKKSSRRAKDSVFKSPEKPRKTPTKKEPSDDEVVKRRESPRKTPTQKDTKSSDKINKSNGSVKNDSSNDMRRKSPRKTPTKPLSELNDSSKKSKVSPRNGLIGDKLKESPRKNPSKTVMKSLDFGVESDKNQSKQSEKKSLDDSKVTKTIKKEPSIEETTKKSTPSRKRTKTADESMTDEDRMEKKRMAMAMYEQFKNRGGPPNPGSKELPKGKPTCLAGLTFIITGVLDSMERDEAADLIKEHGGKVTSSLSKKTSYMVVGEEAGLSKLAKAEDFKTRILSEDGLIDLIREKSGLKKPEVAKPDTKTSPIKKESKTPPIKKEPKTTPTKESKVMPKKKESKTTPIKREIKSEIMSPMPAIKSETKQREVGTHEQNITSVENQAWVEKYKPTDVKHIIGQQGAASNVVKLTNWLTKWYVNQSGTKKHARPNPWAKNDDGASFKAALLSGPPGVGKTTTATLVSKELGFDVVEFNASDTRSKRLLKEEVSELLSNKSLYGYFHGSADAVTVKHVLLMDEVDGMAGNEDRGGIQELIALIKDSSVPIICMCNDRNHTKMRSLVNHCFDLRFNRPSLGQIKGQMMSICFKEGIKLAPNVLDEVITATNMDIRQTLNHLTLLSANKSIPAIANRSNDEKTHTARKDMKMGPWEVVRKVFSAEDHKTMSLHDKSDLFFHDYSLGPLFVQQNYLHVAPKVPKEDIRKHVAMAADSLSLGDLVESRIRSKMAWSMLPTQAMFSSVLPGEYMSGTFTGQIAFPGWLGKYSKSTKRKRMAQEIHDHTRIRTSGSRLSIRLDYAGFLLDRIVRPLKERGLDGVDDALAVLKEYHLLREDLDSLIELTTWPGKKSPFDAVESKVKAALTRAYNKEVTPYSYSAAAAVKKKKSDAADDTEGLSYGDEEESTNNAGSSDDEEDTKVENDAMIKAKKRPEPKASAASKAKATKAGGASRAKPKAK